MLCAAHRAEVEFSGWNFNHADTAALLQHFRDAEAAGALLAPRRRWRCRPMTSA